MLTKIPFTREKDGVSRQEVRINESINFDIDSRNTRDSKNWQGLKAKETQMHCCQTGQSIANKFKLNTNTQINYWFETGTAPLPTGESSLCLVTVWIIM